MKRRLTVLVALGAALLGAAPGSAVAAAPAGPPLQLQVVPASGPAISYFIVHAHPRVTAKAGTVRLINRGPRPLTLLIAPVDALTASTLGSAYTPPGLPVSGPARWTQLSARRIVLAPGRSGTLLVATNVPASTPAGQYLSGVSIEAAGQGATRHRAGSNVAIDSITRYAIGLKVDVPGPSRPRITLTGAKLAQRPSGPTFLIDAANTGNVIEQGVTGTILVTQGRRVVLRTQIGPGTFVTGTSIAYPVLAPGERPPVGTLYRVRATMRYGSHLATLDRTLRFGQRQAAVARQYGASAPTTSGSGGGGGISPLIVIVAFLAGMLALGVVLRLRGGRSSAA